MPLPDRNPKRRCQTALISTTQPITMATPIDDASGTAIARKPQISIRMPQIISGLPVSAADIELVIPTSSLNHRRQSSSSPASRFHLLPAFCCNASLDIGWRTRTLLRRVIVVLSAVLEHKPQAASAKQRTFFAAGDSELPTFYFSSAVSYSLSKLAWIPSVEYKRKPKCHLSSAHYSYNVRLVSIFPMTSFLCA